VNKDQSKMYALAQETTDQQVALRAALENMHWQEGAVVAGRLKATLDHGLLILKELDPQAAEAMGKAYGEKLAELGQRIPPEPKPETLLAEADSAIRRVGKMLASLDVSGVLKALGGLDMDKAKKAAAAKK